MQWQGEKSAKWLPMVYGVMTMKCNLITRRCAVLLAQSLGMDTSVLHYDPIHNVGVLMTCV